jgi:hypothetical protein
MVASTRPSSRQERREWWRRQLTRQQSANVSVADFCQQLGVSVTTFYYWKKRIHEVAAHAPRQSAVESPSNTVATAAHFVPVSLVGKRPVNRIFKMGGVRGMMFGAPSRCGHWTPRAITPGSSGARRACTVDAIPPCPSMAGTNPGEAHALAPSPSGATTNPGLGGGQSVAVPLA